MTVSRPSGLDEIFWSEDGSILDTVHAATMRDSSWERPDQGRFDSQEKVKRPLEREVYPETARDMAA